jgi:hypothetical protein
MKKPSPNRTNKKSQFPHLINVTNGFPYLEPALQQEFTAWASDPELSKLFGKLKSQNGAQWQDHYAEAIIARHLLHEGCELKVEVTTPKGKSADFKASKSDEFFFAHIKRIAVNDVTHAYKSWCYKQFEKLKNLEKIQLPMAVIVNLKTGLTDIQSVEFVNSAKPLIERATKNGEQFKVRDKGGNELGECEVYFPVNSNHVLLCPDSPHEPVPRDSERLMNRLKKAYKQFMPRVINVILFCGEGINRDEFESALNGEFTMVRDSVTNQFVKTQKRQNGFWSGKNNSESNLAVWFEVHDDEVDFKLWIREGFNLKSKLIINLFDKKILAFASRKKPTKLSMTHKPFGMLDTKQVWKIIKLLLNSTTKALSQR